MKHCIAIFLLLPLLSLKGQAPDDAALHSQWHASWIKVPRQSATGYGVYMFRKKLHFSSKPASLVIYVSADNRYKLFVNEQMVSRGPARGDLEHWNYETVDIAPFLKDGDNIIAAKVWNESGWRPEGQISLQTGFLLQSASNAETEIISDRSWKCFRDSSYQPFKVSIPGYYVAGPGEIIDMNIHTRHWQQLDFDDSKWDTADELFRALPKGFLGGYGAPNGWMLIPSGIPQMDWKKQRLQKTKTAEGVIVPPSFPASPSTITIPANSLVKLLLDQGFLTNAYSYVSFSGGKHATISIGYAEALYTKYPSKGNRDETDGKYFVGRKDSLLSDGTANQEFKSLSWRTYRYIQLSILTHEEPLQLNDIYGNFTGYPFEMKAQLQTSDEMLQTILSTGWRTARLCAAETYMDCPFYEQLQYIGDSRIQGLVSLYNSGDDRLLKNALNLMDQSRQPEGVTLSRHPSRTPQYIPTFSLWYIGMLHDYWMYGSDSNFLIAKLPGARDVLQYFQHYQLADGSLKNVPNWMFSDWVSQTGWIGGAAPVGKDGNSSINDLQLLWAYQLAADLESRAGLKELANLYNKKAGLLAKTIVKKYWDEKRQLFADRSEKDLFSQHANSLAILTGLVNEIAAKSIAEKLITDSSLAPASIYFKYYLHLALIKAGFGNNYISWLDKWRENLKMGLTTWAEISDINNARSDCHAWGASPNIEIYRTVLGIDSDAPNFSKIKIEPKLGNIKEIAGEIPHPKGKVMVSYKNENNQWKCLIDLPQNTSGRFIWSGKTYPLKAGKNTFVI